MSSSSSPLPTLDGKYKLARQLGEGGMGVVYEARHTGTGRRCAVKVIASEALAKSPVIIERFRREAMASGAIESQYIAHVLDTGVDAVTGSPYLVMDLLVGEDVYHVIQRLGPIQQDLALRICAQACLGLQKAHEAGIVHRDIKPANLFLASRDHGEIVTKVLDFGIAKMKSEQLSLGGGALTRTGSMLGSPLYISPEQALGKKSTDHRTDLWSLGVVLYELVTGRTPCADATTIGQVIKQICSQPPRNVQTDAPWVKPDVAAIVHQALAMDPDARFQTAEQMFSAIDRLLPSGFALHEKMFVQVSARTRSIPAPAFGVPAEAMRPPAPSVDALPPVVQADDVAPTTTAGFGHSWQPPPPPTSGPGPAMIIAGLVAAAALAVGAGVLFTHGSREEASSPGSSPTAVAPASTAASLEASATASRAVPTTQPSAAGQSRPEATVSALRIMNGIAPPAATRGGGSRPSPPIHSLAPAPFASTPPPPPKPAPPAAPHLNENPLDLPIK